MATYLAVGHSNAPFLSLYRRDGDLLTALPGALGTTILAGTGYAVAFNTAGTHLALATGADPYLDLFARDGEILSRLGPATGTALPAAARGVAYHPTLPLLAVSYNAAPGVAVYSYTGDTYTRLADPDLGLPAGGRHLAWSPDGKLLAVAHPTTPFLTIYRHNGTGGLTKITTNAPPAAALPGGDGYGIGWSPDGYYLTIAHNNTTASTTTTTYLRAGEGFTKVTGLPSNTVGYGYGVHYAPTGGRLAIGHAATPFWSAYQHGPAPGGFVKLPNPVNAAGASTLPASAGNAVGWSPDGNHLAVALAATPYLAHYRRDGDVLVKQNDPAPLTGLGQHLAWVSDPVPAAGYAAQVRTDNPVGYWRLGDQLPGVSAVNEVAGQPAALYNAARAESPNALFADPGGSLYSQGTLRAQAERSPALDLTGPFTLECWAYLTTSRQHAFIESYTEQSTGGYALRTNATNQLQGYVLGAATAEFVLAPTPLPLNTWLHLVFVAPGAGGQMRLYVNGAEVAALTQTVNPATQLERPVYLGARGGVVTNYLYGRMQEAAVYPAALGVDRIAAHYNAGKASSGYIPLVYNTRLDTDTNGVVYYLGTNGRTTAFPAVTAAHPVIVATGSKGWSGTTYDPPETIDRDFASGWTATGPAAGLHVIWDLGENWSLIPNFYSIYGRTGYDHYHPHTWKLQGSNDGATWTDLASHTNETTLTGANQAGAWNLTQPSSTRTVGAYGQEYRYLRFLSIVAREGTPVQGGSVQIGDIDFYGYLRPAPLRARLTGSATIGWPGYRNYVSIGDTNGWVYHLGTNEGTTAYTNPALDGRLPIRERMHYGTFVPTLTTDRDPTTGWIGDNIQDPPNSGIYVPNWVEYDFGRQIEATYYTLRGRNNYANHFPRHWKLQGSNDQQDWTDLKTHTNDSTMAGATPQGAWPLGTTRAFRYFRFLQTGPGANGNWHIQYGDFELYGAERDIAVVHRAEPDLDACTARATITVGAAVARIAAATLNATSDIVGQRTRRFSAFGDPNGFAYARATADRTADWVNPATAGLLPMAASDGTGYANLVDRTTAGFGTTSYDNRWVSFDLGEDSLVYLDYYTLRGTDDDQPLNWRFQGSNNHTTWTDLRVHSGDTTLAGAYTWGGWALPATTPYRYYRHLNTGDVAGGGRRAVVLSEAEFYGYERYPAVPAFVITRDSADPDDEAFTARATVTATLTRVVGADTDFEIVTATVGPVDYTLRKSAEARLVLGQAGLSADGTPLRVASAELRSAATLTVDATRTTFADVALGATARFSWPNSGRTRLLGFTWLDAAATVVVPAGRIDLPVDVTLPPLVGEVFRLAAPRLNTAATFDVALQRRTFAAVTLHGRALLESPPGVMGARPRAEARIFGFLTVRRRVAPTTLYAAGSLRHLRHEASAVIRPDVGLEWPIFIRPGDTVLRGHATVQLLAVRRHVAAATLEAVTTLWSEAGRASVSANLRTAGRIRPVWTNRRTARTDRLRPFTLLHATAEITAHAAAARLDAVALLDADAAVSLHAVRVTLAGEATILEARLEIIWDNINLAAYTTRTGWVVGDTRKAPARIGEGLGATVTINFPGIGRYLRERSERNRP